MKKILIILLIIIVILPLLVYAFRNVIVKILVESYVGASTHYGLTIGKININLSPGNAAVQNMQVLNPRGFEGAPMLTLPQATARFDTRALLGAPKHFRDIAIDISEAVIIRNKNGKFNFDPLFEKKPAPKKQPPGRPAQPVKVQVDRMSIHIGRITYMDYTTGGKPIVLTYNVNDTQVVNNLSSSRGLLSVIMREVLKRVDLNKIISQNLPNLPNLPNIPNLPNVPNLHQELKNVPGTGAAQKYLQKYNQLRQQQQNQQKK